MTITARERRALDSWRYLAVIARGAIVLLFGMAALGVLLGARETFWIGVGGGALYVGLLLVCLRRQRTLRDRGHDGGV